MQEVRPLQGFRTEPEVGLEPTTCRLQGEGQAEADQFGSVRESGEEQEDPPSGDPG
jgi:hypothetical protein